VTHLKTADSIHTGSIDARFKPQYCTRRRAQRTGGRRRWHLAFLHLGGLFVSFMSGNSTRMGVGHAGLCHAYDLENLAIAAIVPAIGLKNAVFQIEAVPIWAWLMSRARW
jgi:hypothetical protein